MQRLTSFAIAIAAAMSLSSSAQAAALVFEPVAATASASCPAPCFNIRMFLEDPTRNVNVTAIQFDVDVINAAAVVAPAANVGGPNVTVTDVDEVSLIVPFPLSATVGASPTSGFDVLVVHASDEARSVNSLKAIRDAGTGAPCSVASTCTIQLNGLNQNQIYLGRFNVTGLAQGTALSTRIRIGGLTGLETPDPTGQLPPEIMALNDGECTFGATGACRITGPVDPPPVPEPAGVVLLGAALMGLGLARRRS